jgi:glucose/arabinose dehydrogenase/mono/diheme cytochrome c family protein
MSMVPIASILLALAAQAGDKKGEEQAPPPASMKIPPAPVVPPAEALKTFKVAPGFRLELVASEPLVRDPVAMEFDPDGRLWVVEMLGYMPDVDGKGEDAPVGDVVVLEDTGGTGKFDKRTVFLDHLVLPRAIGFVAGGVLIAEPPVLWFCKIKPGELTCESRVQVCPYANRTVVEHTSNGLLVAMDNWIYSADCKQRLRRWDGKWILTETRSRGQWGITQDDIGRLFYNSNPEDLRGDLVPCWSPETQNLKSTKLNVQIVKDQTVWPGRVTPGINRGYQKGVLRADGTVKDHTSACGPVIFRGDAYPPEFRGNAFTCEPAANLVSRRVLTEDASGGITGKNPYEKADFIASTDERFRPVNLYTGPDGCLYVVDMYRGIIQHRLYVTTFLRRQILERGLDKGLNLGRIYRVVHESRPPGKAPRLSKAKSKELVAALSHPNGWWRDTAQRLIVDRGDITITNDLRRIVSTSDNPVAKLHALFTLEGLKAVDPPTIALAAADRDPRVREAAEMFRAYKGPLSALDKLAIAATENPDLPDRELAGKEIELLGRLMGTEEWDRAAPGRDALLSKIAARVATSGKAEEVAELLDLIAVQSVSALWRQQALLEGIAAAKRPLRLPRRSPGLVKLTFAADEKIRAQARTINAWIGWPDKAAAEPEPIRAAPLTTTEQTRWERGKRQFAASCAACHQLSGLGDEVKAPPLTDSEWVLGSEERLIRILLNGIHGPVTVGGKAYTFTQDMPPIQNMSSDEIAEVLTYIRREWGHQAGAVDGAAVRKIKASLEDREEPFTEKELLKFP